MNVEAEYRDDLRPRPTRRSLHESLLVLAKGADLVIILNIGQCTCRSCVLCTDRGDICPMEESRTCKAATEVGWGVWIFDYDASIIAQSKQSASMTAWYDHANLQK
jgi:hypothetical protein